MSMTATYSPDDNKIRLYSLSRLDGVTYRRVKDAGFIWAPKQELFVAPMWTPDREDLMLELCGEIEDEDKSLVERAEERADRFEDYSDNRKHDAESAHKAVEAITEHIPLGQPILVGHHSERHARKDAERIENGMRRAIKMWDTAQYWKSRAKGALRHAKYKERPDVRARRIKGIEADKRKTERSKAEAEKHLAFWSRPNLTHEQALFFAGHSSGGWLHLPRKEGDRPDFTQSPDAYSALSNSYPNLYAPRTVEEVVEAAKAAYPRQIERCNRWLAHYGNRLEYEKTMLDEQGASELIAPKSRPTQLPLCNYRQDVFVLSNPWNRGETITYKQIDMTQAEYTGMYHDYKGTRIVENSHRVRTAVVQHAHVAVFLTDSKVHKKPDPIDPDPPKPMSPKEKVPDRNKVEIAPDVLAVLKTAEITDSSVKLPEKLDRQLYLKVNKILEVAGGKWNRKRECHVFHSDPRKTLGLAADTGAIDRRKLDIEAIKGALKNGVQAVAVPQLFPTPAEIVQRMIYRANLHKYPALRILEPSAGTGAIFKGLLPWTTADKVAVEINPELVKALTMQGHSGLHIHCANFLDCNGSLGTFDRIIMNPPFANGADIKHIEHALTMLKPGGRLVAICANGSRQNEKLKPLADTWEELPAGTFKEQGTGVNTVLLTINK